MHQPRQLLIAPELFAPGGIQYVGREVVLALSETAEPLEVWTLRDRSAPSLFGSGVTIRCAGGSRTRLTAWSLECALKSCRNLSITVLHAHLAPLVLPLHVRGASVTVMLHGIEVWRPLTHSERLALRCADRLIVPSRYTAERFCEVNPAFHSARIDICPLGVPPRLDDTTERVDPRAALVVSRLSVEDRYKGHDALLRAWPSVQARVPNARLIVVGDGDDRPRLQALAATVGVEQAIEFVGQVSDAELERWYRRCAFFVLPSTNEGFGLVFLEAMRAGKACVACAGAPAEIVVPDVTGLILQDQGIDRLVNALVRLFIDASLRERLGRQGHARWQETFTSAHFAERFRALTGMRRERAA